MSDKPKTATVLLSARAGEGWHPPPGETPQRITVTIDWPDGRKVQVFINGDEHNCEGPDPADPADWYGPELRDIVVLTSASTYLGWLIDAASRE